MSNDRRESCATEVPNGPTARERKLILTTVVFQIKKITMMFLLSVGIYIWVGVVLMLMLGMFIGTAIGVSLMCKFLVELWNGTASLP